jgi:hypothetical protein
MVGLHHGHEENGTNTVLMWVILQFKFPTVHLYASHVVIISLPCAHRRRSGGGPGGGCVRMPVGTYLYLHAVGRW